MKAHQIEPQQLKVSDAEKPDAQDMACDVLIVATKAYQVRQASFEPEKHRRP